MTKLLYGTVARFLVVAWLITIMPCWLVAQDDSPEVKLKGKTKKALNEVLMPAMAADNQLVFLNNFIPMINGTDASTLAAIDDYCQRESGKSIREYFVNLMLAYAQQGVAPDQVIKNPTIAGYIVSGLISRVDEIGQAAEQHACMDDSLTVPADWKASEQLFWDIHVLGNELDNASRLLEFGDAIVELNDSRLRRSDEGKKIKAKLANAGRRFENSRNCVEERFAELRLQRFEASFETLKKQGDFKTMLTSATSLELDGETLLAFLENVGERDFQNDALDQEGLVDTIKKKLTDGRKLAGDVGLKAGLFRNGLHYWLRGRYGEGPMAFGLLKHPDATSSRYAMEALWMPKERPNVIQNYYPSEETSRGYERRHYYTWRLENRDVEKLGNQIGVQTVDRFF